MPPLSPRKVSINSPSRLATTTTASRPPRLRNEIAGSLPLKRQSRRPRDLRKRSLDVKATRRTSRNIVSCPHLWGHIFCRHDRQLMQLQLNLPSSRPLQPVPSPRNQRSPLRSTQPPLLPQLQLRRLLAPPLKLPRSPRRNSRSDPSRASVAVSSAR